LVLSSKIRNLQVRSKIKEYEQQKHLKAIVRVYKETAEMRVAPHSDWYDITIPEIDIGIVKKELLSINDASEYFGTSVNIIKDLIKKRKISCYRVRDIEYIRNSEGRFCGNSIAPASIRYFSLIINAIIKYQKEIIRIDN